MPEFDQQPMDLTTIRSIIANERKMALGSDIDGQLQNEQARNIEYYYGQMDEYVPADEGTSRAVSTDLFDVIEDLMPPLMEIFAGGDQAVVFAPTGPEDEEAAQQETDYVNYVFYEQNSGFLVMYEIIKDALLCKVGVPKVVWCDATQYERETYDDIDDDAFALIMQDVMSGEVTLLAHEEKVQVLETPEGPIEMRTHSVEIERAKPDGRPKVIAVAPEEFYISRNARTLKEALFCGDKTRPTVAELIDKGYDPDQAMRLPDYDPLLNEVELARDTLQDEWQTYNEDRTDTGRRVQVYENYIKLDMMGDGRLRLYKITTGGDGDEILRWANGAPDIEEVDCVPYTSITPIIVPHRFYGISIADCLIDIQNIKTALLRAWLNNIYSSNNQRIAVGENGASDATLDDLLTNRPGGVVRMKDVSQLREIQNTPLAPLVQPLMEYMDMTREQRTGATRQGMGIDPNALQNTTATGANLYANAAMQRIRMIARIFAETGVKDLFLLLHKVILTHDRKERMVKLRNKWVPVNPRNWQTRTDMTVNVGLGYGSKEQQMIGINGIAIMQEKLLSAFGPDGPYVKPNNIWNMLQKMVTTSGFKNAETFFTEPNEEELQAQAAAQAEQGSPPDPKVIEAQGRLQLEAQKQEAQTQIDAQKTMAEQERAAAKQSFEEQLAIRRQEFEEALAVRKLEAETELAREQIYIQAGLKQKSMDAQVHLDDAAGSDPNFGGEVG